MDVYEAFRLLAPFLIHALSWVWQHARHRWEEYRSDDEGDYCIAVYFA